MLQRKPSGNAPLRQWAYLIAVEIEDGEITPEQVSMRLSDALSFVEGIGTVDVDQLGEITPENLEA